MKPLNRALVGLLFFLFLAACGSFGGRAPAPTPEPVGAQPTAAAQPMRRVIPRATPTVASEVASPPTRDATDGDDDDSGSGGSGTIGGIGGIGSNDDDSDGSGDDGPIGSGDGSDPGGFEDGRLRPILEVNSIESFRVISNAFTTGIAHANEAYEGKLISLFADVTRSPDEAYSIRMELPAEDPSRGLATLGLVEVEGRTFIQVDDSPWVESADGPPIDPRELVSLDLELFQALVEIANVVGEEEINERRALHLTFDATDQVDPAWFEESGLVNLTEASFDIWVDLEGGFISRAVTRLAGSNGSGQSGTVSRVYEVYDINSSFITIAPPLP